VLRIRNRRWEGVPFILKAGKALDDRKAEIRVQFKPPPAGTYMFDGRPTPPNELVIRLQPKEAIYLKTNVKAPGLRSAPIQSELDLSYHLRYPDVSARVRVGWRAGRCFSSNGVVRPPWIAFAWPSDPLST
jgi:glucose-6-phosphate 1-dehydrogenase